MESFEGAFARALLVSTTGCVEFFHFVEKSVWLVRKEIASVSEGDSSLNSKSEIIKPFFPASPIRQIELK